jgi:MFS transporter, OFA family, oxalate/formate antiporter
MIGLGSTAGRFILGRVADRLGRPLSFMAMFVGMALAFVVWAFSSELWALAAPAVITDYFGGRNAGSIIGILYTSVAIGTLIGPGAARYAFDLTHRYMLPILASVAANIIAAAILAATSKAPRSIGEAPR